MASLSPRRRHAGAESAPWHTLLSADSSAFSPLTVLTNICEHMANGQYARNLWRRLTPLYDEGEARAIVRYMLEIGCSIDMADVYASGAEAIPDADAIRVEAMMRRLEKGEPVQYVTETAEFMGRKYTVGPGVLIPREETEGLCRMVEETIGTRGTTVLDMGTGSGCIAITLALDLPHASLTAWDMSPAALKAARHNAMALEADVEFIRQDMLNAPDDSGKWGAIVSNPPYVCYKEQASMHRNVLDYEPGEALFVPDDNPLAFYEAIVAYAAKALAIGGSLFLEINPLHSRDLAPLVAGAGLKDVRVEKDYYGKERYLSARRLA